MNNNKIRSTTFWRFLAVHMIEIPIIQRDYAQGRIGNEKLREKFLKDLKEAIDKNGNPLKLDFVYGSIERNILNPLDGQQRLTTLWLLHWYIAYKAGKLVVDEIRERFKRFSYETRVSSREFCKKLSEFNPEVPKNCNIVELIENQTWFFSAWKQDPTIQAMLHMLGGTPKKDEKGNEISDGIEEVFRDCAYEKYWERLEGSESPIIFYYLDLIGLKLTDDLYIKMNARGKPLTNFENFKADLIDHIKDFNFEKKLKPEKSIAHKLDTTWTDIFWKFRSEEKKIDEIYFAFINRYLLNYLIIAETKEIETNKLFNHLYGKKGDDSLIKYESFVEYKNELTDEYFEKFIETFLVKFSYTLDNFYLAFHNKEKDDINKLFLPTWDKNSSFRFIPEYLNEKDNSTKNNTVITTLVQSHRVVFFAICAYLEKNSFDETTFKQWIRIVWNVVENADIDNTQKMIGVMRLISELSNNSKSIYSFLANDKNQITSSYSEIAVNEERLKSKFITRPESSWEDAFINAEKHTFFKGSIGFIMSDEMTLEMFEHRSILAAKVFDNNGVVEEYRKDGHIFLRALISRFTDSSLIGQNLTDTDEKEHYFKKMLSSNETVRNATKEWFSLKDEFALKEKLKQEVCKESIIQGWLNNDVSEKNRIKCAHEALFKSPDLQIWMQQEPRRIRFAWSGSHLWISRPRSWYDWLMLDSQRNEIISKLIEKGLSLSSKCRIGQSNYFIGGTITLIYKLITTNALSHFTFDNHNTLTISYISNNNNIKLKEYNYAQEGIDLLSILENEILDENKFHSLINSKNQL
jgi:hypothetical protein